MVAPFSMNPGLSTLVHQNVVKLGFPGVAVQVIDMFLSSITSRWDSVSTVGGSMSKQFYGLNDITSV